MLSGKDSRAATPRSDRFRRQIAQEVASPRGVPNQKGISKTCRFYYARIQIVGNGVGGLLRDRVLFKLVDAPQTIYVDVSV